MTISTAKNRAKSEPARKVIVYRNDLLPISQTFIQQQALFLSRWQPVLVGQQLVADGLPLDGLEVVVLRDRSDRLGDFFYRVCRLFRLPHPPSVRKLRRIGAQLVHAHFATNAVDIWPQVRMLGLPMVITLHGYDININREWWEAGRGGKRRRSYPHRLLQMAHEPKVSFIAVSEAIRTRAIEAGIPAGKITVRHIGVDTEKFRPGGLPITQRAKRVLFVGRLIEKKGAAYLIQAFAQARKLVIGAELVIIGDGPLRGQLERLAAELGVAATFVGACNQREVQQHMAQARVLCLPSVTTESGDAEGLPIVILEAQACGLPVITSSRGGTTEGIKDGWSGYAFVEGDVVKLSSLIASLLVDDRLASAMSGQARRFMAANFEINICTSQLESSYERAIARGH